MPPPPRWSPLPLIIASGFYGVALTAVSFAADTMFRQIFKDFKVQLPWPTEAMLAVASVIWAHHGWVLLIPILFVWPIFVVRHVPTPQQPESRRVIARTTRLLVFLIFVSTAAVIVIAFFAPMVQSVSGPQKN